MDEARWRLVGVGVLAVAVSIGAVIGFRGRPAPLPTALAPAVGEPPASAAQGEIVVHVAGAVARPGLVRIPVDSRVADAVAAAGGATPDAALAAINLAAPLADGTQVAVSSVAAGPGGAAPAPVDDGRIHVNRADAAELDGLPGVGPVLAERIVAHRDENGPFATVEDLLDVPGIGESKLDAMRDLIAIP